MDEIGVEVEEDGMVTLRGYLDLTCGECGRELKSAVLEAEAELYGAFSPARPMDGPAAPRVRQVRGG